MLSLPAKINIAKLYALMMVRSALLVVPIMTLYFQDHGLSIQEIFLVQVFFAVAIILVEVPSGYYADIFGRKSALIVGAITGFIGWTLYWLAGGFYDFLFAELFLALSAGFISGADSALLYDTLSDEGKAEEYIKYEGRFLSLRTAAEAIAALIGGVIAVTLGFKELYFWQAVLMFALIPIALSIRNPKHIQKRTQLSMRQIVTFVLRENKRLRFLNIFGALLSASTLVMTWFAQPLWKEFGTPLILFGILWAVANITVSLSALIAYKLDTWFSFKTLFTVLAVTPFALYFLLAAVTAIPSVHYLTIVGVTLLFWLYRGLYNPIIRDYINKEVDSSIRATVLSVQSLFNSLVFAVLSPFIGWIADVWNFTTAFMASGMIFGILSVVFFLLLLSRMRARMQDTTKIN